MSPVGPLGVDVSGFWGATCRDFVENGKLFHIGNIDAFLVLISTSINYHSTPLSRSTFTLKEAEENKTGKLVY